MATPETLAEYDVAMAEILLRRNQAPPDLSYLKLAEASLHSRSYGYNPAMVEAIGARSNRVQKGSSNKGCHSDGGAPWACLPKQLLPPTVSVVGADFVHREQTKEFIEDETNTGAAELIRKIKEAKAIKHEHFERNQALIAQLEQQRRETEARLKADEEEQLAKLGALRQTVKVFNHKGLERRAISAPLPGDSSDDEDYVKRRRQAVAVQDEPIGTMGLRLPPDVTLPPPAESEEAIVRGAPPSDAVVRPSTFWYPRDRQRFKHRMLEEMRWTSQQEDLLNNGWSQTTDLSGPPKRTAKSNVLAGLPEADKTVLEERAQAFIDAKRKRDEEARTRYNTMIARPRPSEMRGTVPVTTFPFAHEEAAPLREQGTDASRNAIDVRAASVENNDPAGGRVFVRPFMFERPPPYKPLPVYRPELPGPVPETIKKLEMPALLGPNGKPVDQHHQVAPPWGRDAEQDVKFQRIWVNKETKTYQVKPLTKADVSRELRLVRDKGLMIRERRPVAAQLTPAQQAFVRSLPSTGPLAMAAAKQLPRASLA